MYGNGYGMSPEEMMQQQQMWEHQQQILENQGVILDNQAYINNQMQTGRHVHVTKKMLLDYMVQSLGACEVVQVDEFETLFTRHICMGSNQIQLLQTIPYTIPTANGPVNAQIVWCPNCRKLIVNRNSLDIL